MSRSETVWMRWARRFGAWLHAEGDLKPLAIFRMGWALAMYMAAEHEAGLPFLYSSQQYHVPIAAWAVPIEAPMLAWLTALARIGAVLTAVGCATRLGVLMVTGTLGYLFCIDLLLFRNHIYLGLLLGGLLLLSPAGQRWSLDALVHQRLGNPYSSSGTLAAAQLIKAQVLIVYAYSVLNKLRRPFLDGFVLEKELPYALRSSVLRRLFYDGAGQPQPALRSVLSSPAWLAVCASAVVCAEAYLAVALPSRRLWPSAVLVGLALHGSIFLLMDIRVFGLLMVSSYLLFRDPAAAAPSPSSRRSPVPPSA